MNPLIEGESMELRPTAHDLEALAKHVARRDEAAEAAEIKQRAADLRKARAEKHIGIVNDLYTRASDIDPTEYTTAKISYLRLRATEWVPYEGNDTSDQLRAECRYVFHDHVTTRLDHSQQCVTTRQMAGLIEIRWRQDDAGYVSTPTNIARLYHDQLTLINESGEHSISTETSLEPDQQIIDDFTSTVLEPMIAGLDAREQLPN